MQELEVKTKNLGLKLRTWYLKLRKVLGLKLALALVDLYKGTRYPQGCPCSLCARQVLLTGGTRSLIFGAKSLI